ncbi:hypothetical protein Ciccas_013642, partial [Cichlidogyrus casuarinus]
VSESAIYMRETKHKYGNEARAILHNIRTRVGFINRAFSLATVKSSLNFVQTAPTMASIMNMLPPGNTHALGLSNDTSPADSYPDLNSHASLASPGAMSTRDCDTKGVMLTLNGANNSGSSSIVLNDEDPSLM